MGKTFFGFGPYIIRHVWVGSEKRLLTLHDCLSNNRPLAKVNDAIKKYLGVEALAGVEAQKVPWNRGFSRSGGSESTLE